MILNAQTLKQMLLFSDINYSIVLFRFFYILFIKIKEKFTKKIFLNDQKRPHKVFF